MAKTEADKLSEAIKVLGGGDQGEGLVTVLAIRHCCRKL